jgi:anti-sigma factor RsiW
MNQTPSHQAVDELLSAAALEILEGEDLGRVLAHAGECAECARRLAEYRGAVATLALALPSQPMRPVRLGQLRERLLARARNNPPASTTERKSAPRTRARWAGVDRWAGWAVAAGLAGVLLVHHGFHRPLAYGWVVAGMLTVALVAFGVYAMVLRGRASALQDRLAQLEGNRKSASSGVGQSPDG